MTLPLFPLPDVVLLPGLVLPLYVFEPRYRELLAQVRRTGEPFGITRLRQVSGQDTPFESRVSRMGTLAHLRHVTDHEDGTASIEVVGGERFDVQGFDYSHSYLSARVNIVPLPEGNSQVIELLSSQLLEGVARSHGADEAIIRANAPDDPLLLASYCTALLPLSGDQREALLCAPSLSERFQLLAALLPARTLN